MRVKTPFFQASLIFQMQFLKVFLKSRGLKGSPLQREKVEFRFGRGRVVLNIPNPSDILILLN